MENNILLKIGKFESAREYWLDKLSGNIEEVVLPKDLTGTSERLMKEFNVLIENELSKKVINICINHDLSLYAYTLSALKVLLHIYSGQEDIIVGAPIYTISDMSYNRYILIRDSIENDSDFKSFLMSVSQTITNGYKNQHYPIDKILGLLNMENERTLFKCMMAFENIHNIEDVWEKINLKECDICFLLVKVENKLELCIIYNSSLYKDSTIKSIAKNYSDVLSIVSENPEIKIKDVILPNDLLIVKNSFFDTEDDDFEF